MLYSLNFLKPILTARELIIDYGVRPFDICQNTKVWVFIKSLYLVTFVYSNLFIAFKIHKYLFKYNKKNKEIRDKSKNVLSTLKENNMDKKKKNK